MMKRASDEEDKTEEDDNYDYDHRRNDIAIQQKKFEAPFIQLLDPAKPWVIRLDGHRFSKFTKGFKKPYDMRIYEAMHRTAAELMCSFNARAAYTQSDEITLLFAAEMVDGEPVITHSGKIQKIATLAAGLCSSRFQHHMRQQAFDAAKETKLLDKLDWAYFDARAFNLPNNTEALKNIIWRQSDCKANSKLNLAHQHFPQKELQNMKPRQLVEKLQKEKGISWLSQHAAYRLGCLIKKSTAIKEGMNPLTGERIPNVQRTVLVRIYTNFTKLDANNERLLFDKTIPPGDPITSTAIVELLPVEIASTQTAS